VRFLRQGGSPVSGDSAIFAQTNPISAEPIAIAGSKFDPKGNRIMDYMIAFAVGAMVAFYMLVVLQCLKDA
jgi:hypothetical protein